jgi:carboxyl-terminal processing protease
LKKLRLAAKWQYPVWTVLLVIILTGCGTQLNFKGIAFALPESTGPITAAKLMQDICVDADKVFEKQVDDYATYYTAEKYKEFLDKIMGSYDGIGVYLYKPDEESRVTISSVMKNTPAFKVKLAPMDEFVAIDGVNVEKWDSEKLSTSLKANPPGTKVKLTMYRPEVGNMEFEITMATIEIPTVEGLVLEDHPEIGYISIISFSESTGEQFGEELQELLAQNIKGLILDLRDNGGGELMSAVAICDYFVPKGKPLVYVSNSTGKFFYEAAKDPINIPVVALQNGNTASASEVLLGAIKDSGAGKTIGVQSYGKGIVQTLSQLQSGAGLRLTTARYFTSGDHNIHKVGIAPDLNVEWPKDLSYINMYSLDKAKDPQFKAALELLNSFMQENTAADPN